MRDIKAKIRELKNKRQEFLEKDDKKMADIFRRRISRLKKKTRRAA
jgi:protein-arginine kinase activator protein McsA